MFVTKKIQILNVSRDEKFIFQSETGLDWTEGGWGDDGISRRRIGYFWHLLNSIIVNHWVDWIYFTFRIVSFQHLQQVLISVSKMISKSILNLNTFGQSSQRYIWGAEPGRQDTWIKLNISQKNKNFWNISHYILLEILQEKYEMKKYIFNLISSLFLLERDHSPWYWTESICTIYPDYEFAFQTRY